MDYSKKSREELIAACKERKLKGYSSKKKEELIQMLSVHVEIVSDSTETTTPYKFKFIDLFCGIGGFHQAMSQLGGKCVYACDIDKKCREIYELNYGLKPDTDITNVEPETIPDFDVLCGGFPCQAFSHAGKQNGFEDTRGTLFRDIVRILKVKQPKYFLLENVKNLKGHENGHTWSVIQTALNEVGYAMYDEPIVMSPHNLGIPQHRERVLIHGWRKDCLTNGELPAHPVCKKKKSHISSILEESIDTTGLTLTKNELEFLNIWEECIQHFKAIQVKLPTFPIWTDVWDTTDSIKELPMWKQKFITQNRDFYTKYKSWLEPWLQNARKCVSFQGSKRKLEWQSGQFQTDDSLWTLLFQFRPSGIRVKRADYSPALVAMAQIVYVGEKKRKLSPREVARLQSFPDSFRLPSSSSIAYKQFGNSVNVEVIKWAAEHLLKE